jgi:hypothetical protein
MTHAQHVLFLKKESFLQSGRRKEDGNRSLCGHAKPQVNNKKIVHLYIIENTINLDWYSLNGKLSKSCAFVSF